MAVGGLGNMGAMVLALFGMVSVVKARRRRKGSEDDPAADKRRADRMETERRLAAYIASRDDGRDKGS